MTTKRPFIEANGNAPAAAAKADAFRDFARPGSALADPGLAHEKGGVVRRPFSKLRRRFLIAVSPQPGVRLAIGTRKRELEPFKQGTRAG